MGEELMYQVKNFIINTLRSEGLTVHDLEPDVPLFGEGLGLDSVDILQLATGMEHAFGVVIPDAAVASQVFRSVRSMAEYIELHSY
ncbi:acyl carrier protein [Geomonas limicola]|uniref:Acyl carrier protein n=1 Tax=Geomonas limicola TaxID=2740186 RepID=A0A6V8NDH1_9BACT|nr:phosphopantetheine-binding protein [Geomonas limicola]GFO69847.1 acyl carrier protein [Geomonas limicola]